MHNAWSLLPTDTGKIFAMRQQSVNQRPALAAGAGMNRNSRRFVYHDEVVVFKQDGERNLFRGKIYRFHRRFDQSDMIARSNHVAHTRSNSVSGDVTLANKSLNSRPGKFRRRFSEKPIQARAGIRWGDIEFAAVLLCHLRCYYRKNERFGHGFVPQVRCNN